MARMHTRKRGQSGSKPPMSKVAPDWVEKSSHEIEDLIADMAKQGNDATTIGLMLREEHAIPSVKRICGKSVSQILRDRGVKVEYPDDLMNLMRKAVRMRKHMGVNHSDVNNKTKLMHVESKIRRLVKYYRNAKKLPANWRYDPDTASLLVK